MKIELNKLKYSNFNFRKFQYLTQIQEAIKIDFFIALIETLDIDKKIKTKFLQLQRLKKILSPREKNDKIHEFYQEICADKALLSKLTELEAKYQDILRRVRKSGINDIVVAYKKSCESEKFSLAIFLQKCRQDRVSLAKIQHFIDHNFKCLLSLTAHPTNPTSLEYTILGSQFDSLIADKQKLNFKKIHDILKKIISCKITGNKKTCLEEMIESELAITNIKIAAKDLLKKWQNIIDHSPYPQLVIPKDVLKFSLWSHGGDADGNPNVNAEILALGIKRLKNLAMPLKIDLRHDASDIEECVNEIIVVPSRGEFGKLNNSAKVNILNQILSSPSKINSYKKNVKNHLYHHEIIKRLILVSKNKKYFDKFIISNHQNESQVLMVLFLLEITKNCHKKPFINIITLSESLADLKNIATVLKNLIDNQIYRQYLAKTGNIIAMIAKSDTVRVAGIAVDYYQDLAAGQILLLKKYIEKKYKLTIDVQIYNGGGNALQRGGGRHDEIAIRHANALIHQAKIEGIENLALDPSLSTIQGQQQQILFSCVNIAKNTIENFALHNLYAAFNINNSLKNYVLSDIKKNNIRQEFADEAIQSYQQKYFNNQYFNELFFHANHLGVALGNLSSRPLKRQSQQVNLIAPFAYDKWRGAINNFNIFNTRAITLDRTIAHSGTFILMFLGLVEAFDRILHKKDAQILTNLYKHSKSFQDFVRNQILTLRMVDIDYAWKMLIGCARPNIEVIADLAKKFTDPQKMLNYSLKQRQEITMAYIDSYIFKVAKFIAKSIFNQDLELDFNYYDLGKILEVYSHNLAAEMQYRKNESIFSNLVESDLVSKLNMTPSTIIDQLDLEIIHNTYIANNIVFNAPLALITIFTTFKNNSFEVHSFLEKINDKDLFFE